VVREKESEKMMTNLRIQAKEIVKRRADIKEV
jgi:hypothetical protein